MSSRESLWFCHRCQAEMMPLMMPEPHCPSCDSAFVEKLENPSDDPRDFYNESPDGLESNDAAMDAFLNRLVALRPPSRQIPPSSSVPRGTERVSAPRIRFEMRRGGPSGTRTVTIGGVNTLEPPPLGGVPPMSEFLGAPVPRNAPQHLLLQYLSMLMPHTGEMGAHPFLPAGFPEPEVRGRMGDYVFNQEALDQIITSMMENASSTRPVPATESIIDALPREVLELGSSKLDKDCAVCKEQFNVETEDPDEQVVVTLPCTHVFHEGCIIPWLKSSGTCPVCRHALIPQPNSHPSEPTPSGSGARSGSPDVSRRGSGSPDVSRRGGGSPPADNPSGSSRFYSMFGGSGGGSRPRQNSDSRHRHHRTRSGNHTTPHFPGAWE